MLVSSNTPVLGPVADSKSDADDVDCVVRVFLVFGTDVEPILRVDSMSKDVEFTLVAMVRRIVTGRLAQMLLKP